MPNFKKDRSKFKMKGFSPFTQYDPVKKPVGPYSPQANADYMNRQVFNLHERSKNKPVDDDTDVMTKKQEDAHRASVLEYNRTKSKPMKEFQKKKIREKLSKMDKNDPEAKLLQDMLNLPKNK
tara:strand:- start:132 stop:500 length:369 start_codon:yes stop_codon:yes gene_type:complete